MSQIKLRLSLSILHLLLVINSYSNERKFSSNLLNNKGKLKISGYIADKNAPNELTLFIWSDVYVKEKRMYLPHRTQKCLVVDGKFKAEIDSISVNSILSIGWPNSNGELVEAINTEIAENGDSIYIKLANYKNDRLSTTFKGRGAEKYECEYKMKEIWDKLYNGWINDSLKIPPTDPAKYDESLRALYNRESVWHYCLQGQLNILNQFENKMEQEDYNTLKTIVVLNCEYFKLKQLNQILEYFHTTRGPDKCQEIDKISKKILLQTDFSAGDFENRQDYTKCLLERCKVEKILLNKPSVHEVIKLQYSNELRDRLLFENIFINGWVWDSKIRDTIERESYKIVTYEKYRELIKNEMDNHKIGAVVYDFSLPDSSGNIVRLSNFKGKIVFMDFWFVGCSGCANYYNNVVSKVEEMLKDQKDVVFITICIDSKRSVWMKGLKLGKYTSDKATNLYTPLGINDPLITQLSIASYPHPILIDRDGRIISNSQKELQANGAQGLLEKIKLALKKE
ncbi:TlpA disulfide reductase family protein [Chitinophaga sp. YIM B06452]|uniref:TlpA family protein disulfide reductase n=1 Tax=Chitinophaga sp. YIM B06452 TaxID=3082158 RepID=UPI0031FF30A4